MKMLKKVTALALGLAMLIGMCAVQAEEACGLTCGAAAEMLLAAMDEHPDPDSAALLQDPLCGALDPQAEITRVQAMNDSLKHRLEAALEQPAQHGKQDVGDGLLWDFAE